LPKPKTAYFQRVCPTCKKTINITHPTASYCPSCKNSIGAPNPYELIPTTWAKQVFDIFNVNHTVITEKALEVVKEKAKESDKEWIVDLLSPLVEVAQEILPTLAEKGFTPTETKPQSIEDIMTPQDFIYAKMGIPTNEWGTNAGYILANNGISKYQPNIQVLEAQQKMLPQKTVQVEEITEEPKPTETTPEKEQDPNDLNLINTYLTSLTPQAALSYMEDDLDLAVLMKPYLNDLTKLQRLGIKATSYTSVKLYLRTQKRKDLLQVITSEIGKKWTQKNIKKIKALLKEPNAKQKKKSKKKKTKKKKD
jgi:hypothetical protein